MSTKKEKLIEEAQKLVSRGQLDKAVKTYQQVLAIDPSAISQRQKLAEVLVKTGRAEEARAEYEAIGKYYASNGFYLKAIAVYKQVQKLDPQDISVTLTLAGLNEKHGLVGNALVEYKQVYDYYEKQSDSIESLKILEKMQLVDQQNVNIKLKLAEAYFHADKRDESYALFGQLALLLQERGDSEAVARLNDRILQFFPEKTEFIVEVFAKQVEEGNAARAVTGLQALLRSNPSDKRVWDLIARAYAQLNQPQRLKAVYQHFLHYCPDEPSARIGLIKCHASQNDINEALALLDLYEQELISSGSCSELESVYRLLNQADPMNLRVLEGLSRACEALGRLDEVASLAPKIRSLRNLSTAAVVPVEDDEAMPDADIATEEAEEFSEAVDETDMDAGLHLPEFEAEQADFSEIDLPVPDILLEPETFDEFGAETEADDEIEIEVEIDDDFEFEIPPAEECSDVELSDEWRDSFGDIFDMIATSPRGVKFGSNLDSTDAQSHYDLGVAFKEMGLYDEAINEFRQSASDHVRRVECLVMQAACLREKGELETAESVLNALVGSGLKLEETDACAVKYELALTFEAQGRNDQAAELMAEIDSLDATFRDVHSRLNIADDDQSLDFSDEDLKNFDLK